MSMELHIRDHAIGTRLDNYPALTIADGKKMQERLWMRTGLAVPYIVCGPCTSCGAPGALVDDLNVHLLSRYNAGGERYANHIYVRDTLSELCRAGDFTCRLGVDRCVWRANHGPRSVSILLSTVLMGSLSWVLMCL